MKAVCDVMHWPGPQLVWVAPLDRTDTPFGAHLVSKQLSVQSYPVQLVSRGDQMLYALPLVISLLRTRASLSYPVLLPSSWALMQEASRHL